MKSAIGRNFQWMVWGVLLACLGVARPAQAALLLTAQPATANPGDVNDLFNIYLTNLGTAPVDVESFSVEITTASSAITFEQATTANTLFPYVFAGNSMFGPVISTSSPGQTLDASDVTSASNSFTVVNPGASFGLGLISFDVAPGAPNDVVPVTFNTSNAFTSVSDQSGNLQLLEFASGSITVSSVPEPASGLLLLVPLALLIWHKRASAHRRRPLI